MLCSCSASAPTWKKQAATLIETLEKGGARELFPVEFHNLLETFEHGEALIYVTKNDIQADKLYLFAMQKGAILAQTIIRHEELVKEQKRQRAVEETARIAEEILQQQIKDAEERLKLQEEQHLRELQAEKETEKNNQHRITITRLNRPTSYTVRRGETLPQIAARPEIYNDSLLWTIIYRANRDQIRDPKHLWSGQVLVIPRSTNSKK